MQQSGGLLLAAGLDGGNTFIFIPQRNENANRIPHPSIDKHLAFGVGFLLAFR